VDTALNILSEVVSETVSKQLQPDFHMGSTTG